MKRSEMIQRLEVLLSNCDEDCPSSQDILEVIEQSGMIPPCCANFDGHGTVDEDNFCNKYVESCYHQWEPET